MVRQCTPEVQFLCLGRGEDERASSYECMTLIQCAFGFGLNNAWILLLAPLALIGVHFAAVLPEERFLTEKFGAGYSAYAARTARYFGWPKAN